MAALLDSDSEPELRINPAYAQRYEQRKKKEELSQLQDKYGDGSESESSDDEEEDEVGELVTPAVDAQIVKTIALLRKRDPAVYDAEKKFFDDAEIEEAKRKWREKQQKLKEDGKPVKLKDFQRQRLLAGAEGESNDEEEEKPLTLAEEQEKARRELKAALEAANEEDEEDENSLFTVRKKTTKDLEDEEEDYKNFLLESIGRDSKDGKHAIADWTSRKGETEDIDPDEKFLWDYILNRGWVEKGQRNPGYDDIVDDEEDEEAVEAAEEFERSYNFRFEEPDATEIVTHARNIESVRRKDDRRKKERESRADRKEEEKKKKEEELRRLKNLKKAEILEKLKKIQEISGAKNIPFSEVDLEADFDPNQYDEQMHGVFGDDYYVDEDPDGKPVFEDDIDIDDIPTYEEDGGEAPLEPEPEAAVESQESKKKRKKKKKKEGANEEEEAFVMDADYLEEAPAPPTKEGKVPKKELKKALDQYLEESYQLDFEDVVGGIPTRFKYRQVKPDPFGLDPVEILLADDKDLNELVSLKKLAPYRAAEKQRKDEERWKKMRKKKVQEFRKRLEKRMQGEDPDAPAWKSKKRKRDAQEGDGQSRKDGEGKKKKQHKESKDGAKDGKERKSKKPRKEDAGQGEAAADDTAEGIELPEGWGKAAEDVNEAPLPDPSFKIKKSKKAKAEVKVSDARLQSYLGGSSKKR